MRKILRVLLFYGHKADFVFDTLEQCQEFQDKVWKLITEHTGGTWVMLNLGTSSFRSDCVMGFSTFDQEPPDKYNTYLDKQMILMEQQIRLLPKQGKFFDKANEAIDPDANEPWRQDEGE